VINAPLSAGEIQLGQFMVLLATAVFIGGRFVPSRYRQRVGIILTVSYIAGIAVFAVYTSPLRH
jgi:hypothetical protein